MNRPLPDNGIPVKHGDLSFVYQGVYHPIVWYGEEPYRPRVETLVIKDGRYVYLNMYDTMKAVNNERLGSYELPGGSIDNDCDKITQAENEVNEEILVKIKNIYHTGVQYYETFSDGNVEEFKKESPLSYRGFMSEVFCAEYDGKFDAKNVEEKDLDPEMQKGKFYAISLVADKLTEYHMTALVNCPFVNEQSKMALQLYMRARGVTIESCVATVIEKVDVLNSGPIYHLSDSNMDGKTLVPRIPNNFLIRNGYEDSTTKRVCFTTSINNCLMGMSANLKNKEFYVHVPSGDVKTIKPTTTQVPDSKITGELWVTSPVKLTCVGKIKVVSDDGKPGKPYTYGNNLKAELYGWKWEWVEKFNISTESDHLMLESTNTKTQNIYVVSMRYDSIFGKTVRAATDSQYNHSAISLDNTLDRMYTFIREKTTTPHSTPNGFSIENIEYMLNKDPNTYAKVVKIPVDKDRYTALQLKLDNLTKFNDSSYDFMNILTIAFGLKTKPKDNAFVCSTFVAYCLDFLGVKLPKPVTLMTPEDISNIMSNNVTYEGPIKKYKVSGVSESSKPTYNDNGDPVPEVCPKCGSKIAVFLKGEPVFLCTDKECNEYFGTVPFSPVDETKRSELPDAAFGIPEERKYPLDTEEHVRSAIKLFNHVNGKYEAKLAKNIIKKMDEYNITDITIGEKNRLSKYIAESVVIESPVPVLEAPGDDDEDEATDYTDDIDVDFDDEGDEATDYTDDVDDPMDEEDEATDYTDDVESDEEPSEDDTDTNKTEEPTDDETGDEATDTDEEEAIDYTDDVGDTDTENDDTTSDDTTDTSTDDTENTDVDKNSIVKNYNLILDFQTLFRYLEDICTSLESTVFKSPIQNSALTQIVNNMRKIKTSVANYIEFNFGNDYVTNLYNYNIFVKSLKLNLEMLRVTKDLYKDESTNK